MQRENGPEFPAADLIHWLQIAEARWGADSHTVTVKRSGATLAVFQDGKYRAGIDLDDDRPQLSAWADEDA